MKLFIGNGTRHVYDFHYRMAETMQIRSQKIQPGAQVLISGELTKGEIDYIVAQHSQYGMISEDRIDQTRAFAGTCYSVDKPISATRLVYLLNGNLGHLVKRGEEIRRVNAVAHNNGINSVLAQSGAEQIPVLELTVQQENKDPNNHVDQMSEGILVSTDGNAEPLSGRGRRRVA